MAYICAVCNSRFNIGIYGQFNLCQFHSLCQTSVIKLIQSMRSEGTYISKTKWDEIRLNSYDRDSLIPYMDDETLLSNVELTLRNCSRSSRPASTYEEALQLYAAELAKRLKEKVNGTQLSSV